MPLGPSQCTCSKQLNAIATSSPRLASAAVTADWQPDIAILDYPPATEMVSNAGMRYANAIRTAK